MEFSFWLLILFTIVYEPIIGFFAFKKFKLGVRENQHRRVKFYQQTMLGLWIPSIFIFLLALFTELSFQDIGLTFPAINTESLGPLITYSVFVLAILYFIGLLYYSIGYQFSKKMRSKLREAKQKEWDNVHFSEILPITNAEKKLWNYVSLTAGITEEVIYRGFLIFAFSYLFPDLSIWFTVVLSSLLFGLAHTYQGIKGVLQTTVVGVIFSILYIGVGSILPLMLLHFLIDYVAKLGDRPERIN
ncbi:CPBP family intramembrane metalloprotease [Robertmurraya sp. DFI.2.37]|uniref:CPBP family intramembrane glutamic endopeptidase n=1 Tax=Robertmurraya sp. DFI.2.37 TaxID=3031819 RepID=UPI001245AAF7|nr:CPBP family intramembrane glutamic endopeptidase [Robertmurraya sp. DFI.2.37]MDF1507265.1 CPBP family intramembrane metalloprotease [Robertmurraya sp. DFI.2.37]